MKLSKIVAMLVAAALAICLAACSADKGAQSSASGSNSDIATLMATEPSSASEAATLFAQLMQKENDILTINSSLWEKVFLSANKNTPMVEDGSNYGDFLLATIEGAKDKFTAAELETLKECAQQIKEIENKLTVLEQKYPGCGSKPSEGESVDASSAGMTGGAGSSSSTNASSTSASDLMKFPSFQGKDLDGNEVNSNELFANNTVTVVNFWFTTCKPCVGELGDWEALNKTLAEKGGSVVGINSFTLDGDKTAISEAKDVLAKKGATYQNVWFASNSEAGKLTSGLYSYPTTYVVDKNGQIVGQVVGAITSDEQAKALNALIDKAIANSAE